MWSGRLAFAWLTPKSRGWPLAPECHQLFIWQFHGVKYSLLQYRKYVDTFARAPGMCVLSTIGVLKPIVYQTRFYCTAYISPWITLYLHLEHPISLPGSPYISTWITYIYLDLPSLAADGVVRLLVGREVEGGTSQDNSSYHIHRRHIIPLTGVCRSGNRSNNIYICTVNSFMFVGINICIFETNPCLWGLIFAISSGLVNYLGTRSRCAGINFCDLKTVK